MSEARPEAVKAEQISVQYGGFRALDQVTVAVPRGQRCAIIGPNGAGKSTLLRVMSGDLKPTSGRILLHGEDVTGLPEHLRSRRGIARTYQITTLFKQLSVLDNVYLAVQGRTGQKWSILRSTEHFTETRDLALSYLEQVGLAQRANEIVARLSYGEQRQLEIAVAQAGNPSVLLLDEPAAGLSPGERQLVAAMINKVPRDVTVVMIDHDMSLIMSLAEHILVLHHGQLVAEGSPEEVRANSDVRKVYLGAA